MNRIIVLILFLFLFSCIPGGETSAKEKSGSKKKVKYVKSKYGLKALMELAKNRGSMIQEFRRETENYRKVKVALDHGELKYGETASRIKSKYGEPVIMLSEEKGRLTKWVYKPGQKSFFSGEKVYLVFGEDDKLIGWHSLQPEPGN
jgi:hypothetical protein